jgi:hypothetical protein
MFSVSQPKGWSAFLTKSLAVPGRTGRTRRCACHPCDVFLRDSNASTNLVRLSLMSSQSPYPPDAGDGDGSPVGGSLITPIFLDNYPDPDIIQVDRDPLPDPLCHRCSPALLSRHSRKLFQWPQPGHNLNQYNSDFWAPELVHHNCQSCIYDTMSVGHQVVTAPRIEAPWNAPVDLHVPPVDPGHAVAQEGRRFPDTA